MNRLLYKVAYFSLFLTALVILPGEMVLAHLKNAYTLQRQITTQADGARSSSATGTVLLETSSAQSSAELAIAAAIAAAESSSKTATASATTAAGDTVTVIRRGSVARAQGLAAGTAFDLLQPQSGHMRNGYPGAVVNFPVTGDINALIVFVQRKDDLYEDCRTVTGFNEVNEPVFNDTVPYERCAARAGMQDSWDPNGVQSFTDNPATEWPADLPDSSARGFRQLPAWAPGIIDPPNSTQITDGSLTDLYHRYSNGTFNFRGKVWPYTYVPQQNTGWYEENRGSLPNGLARLNSEIIRFIDNNHEALDFEITPEIFDNYTNGEGEQFESDGNFDMLIIVYRFSGFNRIYTSYSTASAVAHLGGMGTGNQTLGGMNIVDNPGPSIWWGSGSGVVANGYTQKRVMAVIMHEIGHRHFGGYHTHESRNLDLVNADAYSVMGSANNHTMSGPDKIKLNWANVAELDINRIAYPDYLTVTLHDGNRVNNNNENEILWIRNGDTPAAGDFIIEARLKSFFMDMDPEDLGMDADGKDYSLPGNGLYIYKAQNITARNRHRYSNLQNGSLPSRRKYFGINDSDVVFGEGSQLIPFMRFNFQLPPSNGLDEKLSITHIKVDEDAGTVSFRVWRHLPGSTAQ